MYRWLTTRSARLWRRLTPGVFVEEVSTLPRTIRAVETGTAAFLGETERGPSAPRYLTSVTEFTRHYGTGGHVAAAVAGFFDNGGKRCYVGRVSGADAVATATLTDADGNPSLEVSAVGPGEWGTDVAVTVADSLSGRPDEFELVVAYRPDPNAGPAVEETYGALSVADDAPAPIETRVTGRSTLVEVDRIPNGSGRPTNGTTNLSGPGAAPDPSLTDYEGNASGGSGEGLAAIAGLDDVSLVCVPNAADVPGLPAAVESHCATTGDRFAVLDAPRDADVNALAPPVDSPNVAVYYPWLVVDGGETVPPCGHVAGIYARTDAREGVHEAPANEPISGVVGLQRDVTATDQSTLNPRGINCIREFSGRGIRVWGARTASTDPEWRYVNVRRLRLYLEESIEEGLDWVAFEPNAERTWRRVRAAVENFLTDEWKRGALQGAKPSDAFFLACDRSTMTAADVAAGRLVVRVGFAPLRPAEFAVFEVTRQTDG